MSLQRCFTFQVVPQARDPDPDPEAVTAVIPEIYRVCWMSNEREGSLPPFLQLQVFKYLLAMMDVFVIHRIPGPFSLFFVILKGWSSIHFVVSAVTIDSGDCIT